MNEHSVCLLDESTLRGYLPSTVNKRLQDVFLFDELPSTNDYLMAFTPPSQTGVYVCLAESQTHGKGRQGKRWISPFGANIYLSLLYPFSKSTRDLTGLSIASALCVTQALADIGIEQDVTLKWPNDIFWKQRKLAGLLVESKTEKTSEGEYCHTVIGIGLNVAMSKTPTEHITQPWVDIQTISGQTIDRNRLAGLLIQHLVTLLDTFQTAGLAPFIKPWQALDSLFNQTVSLNTPTGALTGTARGINTHGHLLIEKNNRLCAYASGEVKTLRRYKI